MARIHVLTFGKNGTATIAAPETLELRLELKTVLAFIQQGCFVIDARFDVPSRSDPAVLVMVKREAHVPLISLKQGEEAAWREHGTLPSCTRELIIEASKSAIEHEVDELFLDANGVRAGDPHLCAMCRSSLYGEPHVAACEQGDCLCTQTQCETERRAMTKTRTHTR